MRKALQAGLIAFIGIAVIALSITASADQKNFRAHLAGGSEVPPVATKATGQALFNLNSDGTELSYRLIVANIDDVRAAHIHNAAAGINGPVVAFLYGGPTIEGQFSGVLAEGTITESDLVGPLEDMPLSDLIALISAGNAYVNVHTDSYPGGEIRGQVE